MSAESFSDKARSSGNDNFLHGDDVGFSDERLADRK
jgi:hypothetical protein